MKDELVEDKDALVESWVTISADGKIQKDDLKTIKVDINMLTRESWDLYYGEITDKIFSKIKMSTDILPLSNIKEYIKSDVKVIKDEGDKIIFKPENNEDLKIELYHVSDRRYKASITFFVTDGEEVDTDTSYSQIKSIIEGVKSTLASKIDYMLEEREKVERGKRDNAKIERDILKEIKNATLI